jgi:hypothetical protein
MAVGGYGRGEMALHSDVDIAFVTPWKPTGWTEPWSRRSSICSGTSAEGRPFEPRVDELIAAPSDHDGPHRHPRGALRVGRRALFDEVRRASGRRSSPAPRGFVTEKLDERDAPQRMGDSRYVVEPNVKEGKGGFATSTRSSGSANMPIGSQRRRPGRGGLLSPRSCASSSAPSASSGRCAATCTCSPAAPRNG